LKKSIAVITLAVFMLSSVFGEALRASVTAGPAPAYPARTAANEIIPPTAGRITGLWPGHCPSNTLVVNIQDLHCHAETQRNISKILAALDDKYGLDEVYVEGGYGKISTAWMDKITSDRARATEIADELLNSGLLTGAEYYSVASNRHDLLRGLEDETFYRQNIARLDTIFEKRAYFGTKIAELERDLGFITAEFIGPANKKLNDIISRRKLGRINDGKYYALLAGYVARINADAHDFGDMHNISITDYPNILSQIELTQIAKKLNYNKIPRQAQQFIADIKSNVTYSQYNSLLQKTANFTKTDDLYIQLAAIRHRETLRTVIMKYPDLSRFLDFTEKNSDINPLELINEERRLIGQIRIALSADVSEVEVSFVADFFDCFRDYLSAKLSAEDYAYFNAKFGKFRNIWAKYAPVDKITALTADFQLLNDYYKANETRNEIFIKNMPELIAGTNVRMAGVEAAQYDDADRLLGDSRVILLVTGGFHTQGINKLLRERNIPYITITPNVTTDAAAAGVMYSKLVKKQAAMQAVKQSAAPKYTGLTAVHFTGITGSLALIPGSENVEVISVSEDQICIELGGEQITLFNNGKDRFEIRQHTHDGATLKDTLASLLLPLKTIIRNELVQAVQGYINLLSETEGDDFIQNPPDVFLVLGQPDMRVYVNFAKKWKAIKENSGREVPVVVAGGWGRGTAPLITRTIERYGDRIDSRSREWMLQSLNNEISEENKKITEADVVKIIFGIEGVKVTAIEEKKNGKGSTKTLENFLFSKKPIAAIFGNKVKPSVAIVTRPDLLLRAFATASGEWLSEAENGWQIKRFSTYDIDAGALSDSELIELAGYSAGYPQKYLNYFEGTPYYYNYQNSEIRGVTKEFNGSVAKIPDSSPVSDELAEYVRKGVPLRDEVKTRLEKYLDTGDVVIDLEKNTLCFKNDNPDGATGGMFGISRNVLITALEFMPWLGGLNESASRIAILMFRRVTLDAAGIRKRYVYTPGEVAVVNTLVSQLIYYWNKLRKEEGKLPVDKVIISEADADVIFTKDGLGIAGMFEVNVDGTVIMRCARCSSDGERIALMGHEVAEYLALNVSSSWHYKALDYYLGENRLARGDISQNELFNYWHACQRQIVNHPDSMLPVFVDIDREFGFIVPHMAEDVKRFDVFIPSLAMAIASLLVRAMPGAGLHERPALTAAAIESFFAGYYNELVPPVNLTRYIARFAMATLWMSLLFIGGSSIFSHVPELFAAFRIDVAPGMPGVQDLLGSNAVLFIMASAIIYNLWHVSVKILNLFLLLLSKRLGDDGFKMMRVLNLAFVFKKHEGAVIVSSVMIAFSALLINMISGSVPPILVAPLLVNSAFWIWSRYEMWIVKTVLLLSNRDKKGRNPRDFTARKDAARSGNPEPDVYLDYHYGITSVRSVAENINELGALWSDDSGNLHTNIYIFDRHFEDMESLEWKDLDINVDGRQLRASAMPGALVLFADGADMRNISAAVNDAISPRGSLPGSNRLSENLKNVLSSLDVDLKAGKFKPGITIDWSSHNKVLTYARDGSLKAGRHYFVDGNGVINKDKLKSMLGDMVAMRNADSFAMARSNSIYLDLDAGMEADDIESKLLGSIHTLANTGMSRLIIDDTVIDRLGQEVSMKIARLAQVNGWEICINMTQGTFNLNSGHYAEIGFPYHSIKVAGFFHMYDLNGNKEISEIIDDCSAAEQLRQKFIRSNNVSKTFMASELAVLLNGGERDVEALVGITGMFRTMILSMYTPETMDTAHVQKAAHALERKKLNIPDASLESLLNASADGHIVNALKDVNIGCVNLYLEKIQVELEGTSRENDIPAIQAAFSEAVVKRLLAIKELGAVELADHQLEVILGQNLFAQKSGGAGASGLVVTPEAFLSENDVEPVVFYGRLNLKIKELCARKGDPAAINAVVALILAHAERKTVQREEKREKLLSAGLTGELFKSQ